MKKEDRTLGPVRGLIKKLMQLNRYSKLAIKLGFTLMICFYIIAIAAHLIAPTAKDYFYAMSVYRGCLEAAPALLAVGVCAGLLGDLMLSSVKSDEDSSDRK